MASNMARPPKNNEALFKAKIIVTKVAKRIARAP
jgi:hypothetical protein